MHTHTHTVCLGSIYCTYEGSVPKGVYRTWCRTWVQRRGRGSGLQDFVFRRGEMGGETSFLLRVVVVVAALVVVVVVVVVVVSVVPVLHV